IGLGALCVPSEAARPATPLRAQAATDNFVYLPVVYSQPSPAGTYDCNEYEFGLIWTTDVITLSVDGSSIYAYNPPASSIVTGTWTYSPTAQEIAFTGFRWITATVELPNRLWARKYLPDPGFEIGLECARRGTALN